MPDSHGKEVLCIPEAHHFTVNFHGYTILTTDVKHVDEGVVERYEHHILLRGTARPYLPVND